MDGRTFSVDISSTEKSKSAKTFKDEISFKAGKLSCDFIKKITDFDWAIYEVSVDSSGYPKDDVIIQFTASTWKDRETLTWKGQQKRDMIEGTVSLAKNAVVKKEFSFIGIINLKTH